MFDLRKNIIPTKAFISALGIAQNQFYKKNETGAFSDEEKSIIFNVIKNYPIIYPNVPLLEKYMRMNNINVSTFTKKLEVQENFFYTFKAIALAEEPQNDIIEMLKNGEPLNLNKLIDPLANAKVKKMLKKEGINFLNFKRKFLNDHPIYRRYLTSYTSIFLNLEYTDDIQDYMIDYIANNIIV